MPGCCGPVAEWLPVLVVAAVAFGYAVCVRSAQLARPGSVGRAPLAFAGGSVTVAIALSPPFHDVAERSFTGHMVQHVLLISAAAPLVVLGEPGAVVLRALSAQRRRQWQVASAGVRRSLRLSAWGPWAGA